MPPRVSSEKYCETAGFRNVLPSHSGAASVVAARKDKWSGDGKISSSSDGGKYGKAIAPIPLGSLPSYDMKQKPEKSGLSCDKEGDEGRKEGKTSGDMDRKKEELWTPERDKLAAVIADAKEFLSMLDYFDSKSNTFLDAVDVLKDSGESRGQYTSLKTDALTQSTSIDQSLSRERLKVSSGIALVVQEKNACGTETMPEDRDARGTETMSEDEDEVRISSPAVQEENALGTETMQEDKDFRGTETMSEDEDEVRISSPAVQEENARGTETMSEDKDFLGTETMLEDEDEVRISSPAVQEENAGGTETMSEDKDVRGTETMLEDEDEVRISSPAVQEENARGTETMSEDKDVRGTETMLEDEDEDEVRISSPAVQEENTRGTETMSEDKDVRGTETMSEDEDEVRISSPAVQEENARGTETMSEDKDFLGTETMLEDEDEVRISSPAVQEENAGGTETMSEDKDVRGTETMLEDEDEVRISSPAVQEENARGTETMSEDKDVRGTETMLEDEDEDEVRISSPAVQEENTRGTETMSEDKDVRGTETMSEDEDEVRISSPAVQEENARGTETMSEDKDVHGTETMLEDEDEDEVRISSPAVQEENTRGTETMSEDKDVRGTETMSEDDDEVRISSPAVQEENARGTETMSEDEDEITILSPAEWKVSQLSVNNKNECVKPYRNVVVDDYAELVSVAAKADQPVESFPNSEINLQRNYFTDSGQYSRDSEGERYDDASKKMFPEDDGASGTHSLKCTDEHEYAENHKHLINFEIVPRDHPKGRKVMEALRLFKEEYDTVSQQNESEPGVGQSTKVPHYAAAKNVRLKGMDFSPDKPFGHIPGIEIGHEFSFRTELAIAGLNNQPVKGIAYVNVDCTMCATSVVDSGRYGNKAKEHDILIYSGEGGNPVQKLVGGNLALFNSMKKEFPVRVIRKRTCPGKLNQFGWMRRVYVYDGLYKVNKCWQEEDDQSGKWGYKFELQRLPGQLRIGVIPGDSEPLPGLRRNHGTDATVRKPVKEVCVVNDISQEKEKFKVRAMNGVDDEHPPPFTYTIKNVYPLLYWFKGPAGCDCVNGCSDSVQCPCVKKNGGEIPYNENGQLLKSMANGVVHECGPSCKCPPSCMNRVSQYGPHLELEIFKTKSMGWGVRSRNHIFPGSFICEYVGEILSENEANQKIGKDEYLFDICHGKSHDDDYTLDAANYGNISRFINHSCDPNVLTQKVFYDHEDKKMPHIMFFASKKIPPRHEIVYDYNYGNVHDAHGKLKSKACHCGSRKCTGKLY